MSSSSSLDRVPPDAEVLINLGPATFAKKNHAAVDSCRNSDWNAILAIGCKSRRLDLQSINARTEIKQPKLPFVVRGSRQSTSEQGGRQSSGDGERQDCAQ